MKKGKKFRESKLSQIKEGMNGKILLRRKKKGDSENVRWW